MATNEAQRKSSEARLDSWTEIAEYLGRSTRTVQRWHANYRLPIRRMGGANGPVFAYAGDLDAWLWNRGREDYASASARVAGFPGADALPERALTAPDISDVNAIAKSATKRSAELVVFACKMTESLSHSNIQTITRLFRHAIDLDPENARAFAGLSMALIIEGLLDDLPIVAATSAAKAALARAVEIDPELREAECARLWLKMILDRNWQEARIGFDQELEGYWAAGTMAGRALLCVAEGSPERASELLLKASRDHPLDTRVAALHCWTEYLAGRFARVLALVQEARVSGHSGPVLDAVEALTSIQMEEPQSFIPRIEALHAEEEDHQVLRGALGYAYAVDGQHQKARAILETMTSAEKHGTGPESYAIALMLLGLDERRMAVQWLEGSFLEGSLWSFGFPSDPMLLPLRNDPGFLLFWSKVNYPAPAKDALQHSKLAG